jgi:hypothetical protein
MRTTKKPDGKRAAKITSGTNLVGAAGRTALAVHAATGKPGLAAAAASFILLPQLISTCIPAVFERRRTRAQKWWAWVTDANAAEEADDEEIERRIQEAEVQDVIFASLREVLDAPAEEAVRPLGLLTREYVRAGAKRDRFFRGVVRMLGESTGAELEQTSRLLAELVRENGDTVQVEITGRQPSRVGIAPLTNGDPPRGQRTLAGEFPDIEDVFQLLKRHGLGSERTISTWAMVPDADKLVVERAIAERILKYLS